LLTHSIRIRFGSTFVLVIFTTVLTQALTGCREHVDSIAASNQVVSKVMLTKAERIALVKRILTKRNSLPSEILDAHFEEHTSGPPDPSDFAPEDYVSYMYIKVSPEEMGKWDRLLLRPLGYAPQIDPTDNYAWWLNGKDMTNFEFFEPHPLASRDGWVVISRKTGELWIYGFTT
jgi:hypothetical protein